MFMFMWHRICLHSFKRKGYNGDIFVFFYSLFWQNDSPVGRIKFGKDDFIVLVSTVPSASWREIENLSDRALCSFYTLAGFTVHSSEWLSLTEWILFCCSTQIYTVRCFWSWLHSATSWVGFDQCGALRLLSPPLNRNVEICRSDTCQNKPSLSSLCHRRFQKSHKCSIRICALKASHAISEVWTAPPWTLRVHNPSKQGPAGSWSTNSVKLPLAQSHTNTSTHSPGSSCEQQALIACKVQSEFNQHCERMQRLTSRHFLIRSSNGSCEWSWIM